MISALRELVASSVTLARAKWRARKCPPHEPTPYGFCERCGARMDDEQ